MSPSPSHSTASWRTSSWAGSPGAPHPCATFTPLLGAELIVEAGASTPLEVDPSFEHGVLVDQGDVSLSDARLQPGELGYVGAGPSILTVTNSGAHPARLILLGGTPFDEEILMWWNFVGRSHDEIVAHREAWEPPKPTGPSSSAGWTATPAR